MWTWFVELVDRTNDNLPPIVPTLLQSDNDTQSSNSNTPTATPTLPSIDDIIAQKYGHCNKGVQARQKKRLLQQQIKARKRARFNDNNPNLCKQPNYTKCPWTEIDCREDIESCVHR